MHDAAVAVDTFPSPLGYRGCRDRQALRGMASGAAGIFLDDQKPALPRVTPLCHRMRPRYPGRFEVHAAQLVSDVAGLELADPSLDRRFGFGSGPAARGPPQLPVGYNVRRKDLSHGLHNH